MGSKALLFSLCVGVVSAIPFPDWQAIPPQGITQDMEGDFVYGEGEADRFVLQNAIFFLNPNATLSINARISGDWGNTVCGLVFCADNQRLTFNKGNLVFDVDTSNLNNPNVGVFSITNQASLDINSNLRINLTSQSQNHIFDVNSANLNIADADLVLNAPNRRLFKGNGTAVMRVNQGGNRFNQRIVLEGDLELLGTASLALTLGNAQSYFKGEIILRNASNLAFSLNHSQAVILNYDQRDGSQASFDLQASSLDATLSNANGTRLNLGDNSKWGMLGDSQISDLEIRESTIDFLLDRYGGEMMQRSLHANSLKGNGTFIVYADVQDRQVDRMQFAQAEGNHKLKIYYHPQTFTQDGATSITSGDGMVVARIDDAQSQAVFEGDTVQMGLLQYQTNLTKTFQGGGVEWLISSIVPKEDSPIAFALSTALNTPYRIFDFSASTLSLRLGDLRKYPKDYGLYFRYYIGLNQLKSTQNTLETEDVWMGFAGGFDMNKVYVGRTDFLGFGFDIALLDSKNQSYHSKSQSYGVNLYYSWIFQNRFYMDAIFKYAYAPTSVSFENVDHLDTDAKFDSHLLTLGFELGKKILFGKRRNAFYFEPQGKLTSGVILPTNLKVQDSFGEEIRGDLKVQFPLLTRASLYLGYEWNEKFVGDFKVGTFVEYSLNNGGDILLRDSKSELKRRFSGDLDVGVSAIGSIEIKDFLRLYFEFDSSFLGDYTSAIAFNAGIRWSFGERYVPPPPPPADPQRFKIRYKYQNRQRTIPVVKEDEINNMKHHGTDLRTIRRDYLQSKSNH